MSAEGETMLTVKTDGYGKIWAEDLRGEVVGLGYTTADGPSSWDVVEAVVSQARFAAERQDVS